VIGVHTPEFPFEKDVGNVRRAVKDMKDGLSDSRSITTMRYGGVSTTSIGRPSIS